MKRAQITELLANVRATIVSFISIVMFVALGVALYLGIQGSAVALERSADKVFNSTYFHDIEVLYPYGLSKDDLDAMAKLDSVAIVEPAYVAYLPHATSDGNVHMFSMRSLTETLDVCTVTEGRLPSAKGELVMGEVYAERAEIAVGDKIVFVHDGAEDDADGMRYLVTDTFTVTGFVSNPNYISKLGGQYGLTDKGSPVEAFAYTVEDSFDGAAYGEGFYPCALIRATSTEGLATFSDNYRTALSQVKSELTETGEPRAAARYDEVRAAAQALVDEAKGEYEEGEAKIKDGEKQIADAQKQIEEGEDALRDGQSQLDVAIAKLESGEASYAATKAMGDQLLADLADSLNNLQASYDETAADYAQKEAEVNSYQAQLDTFIAKKDALRSTVEPKLDRYDAIWEEINTGSTVVIEGDDGDGGTDDDAEPKDGGNPADGENPVDELLAECQQICDEVNAAGAQFNNDINELCPEIAKEYSDSLKFPELTVDSESTMDQRIQLIGYDSIAQGCAAALESYKAQLAPAKATLDNLKSQLDDGWAKYYDTENRLNAALAENAAKIEEGREQIAAGQATLDEKTRELEEGKRTVEERTKELEEGKALLEEGGSQIADAQAQVDGLASMNWIVNTRFMTGGTILLNNIITLTKNLRVVMASLFVIVGLLVCYSALSRIVNEQTRQIGTKKALGFRSGEITASYLGYTLLAVLAGILLGILISVAVVQGILIPKLSNNFQLGRISPVVDPLDTLIISLVEIGLLLASTWLACSTVLKRSAVDLLAGGQAATANTHFYEKWAIWRKLPILTQTMINNCISDPRRIIGTLIGVAGCTALLVTSLTLDGNLTRSLKDQFVTVYDFDATISFDGSSEGAVDRINAVLDKNGCGNRATIYCSTFMMDDTDGLPATEIVFVPTDEQAFSDLFHLSIVPSSGVAPSQGAWVSRSHADHRGLEAGDHIDLCTVGGEYYHVTISGFYTYMLPNNTMVMSADYYTKVFGREVTPNAILVDLSGADVNKVSAELADVEGFLRLKDERAEAETMQSLFKGVTNAVVAIYTALSALMAIVVLLNLDFMFIDERKRELITLMINGFSVGDAKAYIYRDAIVMTIIGIIVGVSFGIAMGAATVGAVEWQSCSFIKDAYVPGCLIGAGLSAVFAAIMMLIALRRIPRFSLTDIARY